MAEPLAIAFNFDIIHTKGVIRAMELLLEQEKEDKNILIPAAILHDTGWSKIPPGFTKN